MEDKDTFKLFQVFQSDKDTFVVSTHLMEETAGNYAVCYLSGPETFILDGGVIRSESALSNLRSIVGTIDRLHRANDTGPIQFWTKDEALAQLVQSALNAGIEIGVARSKVPDQRELFLKDD